MIKLSAIFLVGALLLLSGCQGSATSQNPDSTKKESTPPQVRTQVSKATGESETAVKQQKYVNYSSERYDSLNGKKPFGIFFHATWCPTCGEVEREILGNLSDLPEGTVILKADYDKEKELEKKYGIASQSILVLIDQNGNPVEKLAAPTLAQIKNSFARLL